MKKIGLIALLFLIPLALMGQEWYQSSYSDFSTGLRSNTEIISPDPDGLDDGALTMVAADTIKVLQIYPDGHNTVLVAQAFGHYASLGTPPLNLQVFVLAKTAFDTVSSLNSILTVINPLTGDSIDIQLKDFHVLFFGIADSYGASDGSTDISSEAAQRVREFARLGKGVIFAHDTIWATSHANHPNFNSLSDVSGLSTSPIPWTVFTYVKRVYSDISDPVLNIPFILPESFETTPCHQTGQYVVTGNTMYVGTNATGTEDYGIYWHTYHNTSYDSYGAYFSYGHIEREPEPWEAKAMINTMYFSYHGGRGIGVFTSRVYNAEDTLSLTSVDWSADVPMGSELTIEVRYASDAGVWSEWRIVSSGELPIPFTGVLFQYRVSMTRAPGSEETPILHWIKLSFFLPTLTAEILSPPAETFSSCINQDIQIAFHTSVSCPIDSSSIDFKVNGIHYEISDSQLGLVDDTLLVFTPGGNWLDGEEIQYRLLTAANICGGALEDTLEGSFTVDLIPPEINDEHPTNSSTIGTPNPDISVTIIDSGAGVDTTSLILTINDTLEYSLNSPWLTFEDSVLTLNTLTAGLSFTDGETINVKLSG